MKKIVLALSFFLVGCVPNASNMQYSSSDLASAAPSVEGVVVSKRPIQVAGTSSGVGTVAGALAGTAAASNVGGGRGQTIAMVGGALLGAMAGSAAEERMTKQKAFEYIVRIGSPYTVKQVTGRTREYTETKTSSQRLVTVIQSDVNFNPGDRVFVIMSAKPRIVPDRVPG